MRESTRLLTLAQPSSSLPPPRDERLVMSLRWRDARLALLGHSITAMTREMAEREVREQETFDHLTYLYYKTFHLFFFFVFVTGSERRIALSRSPSGGRADEGGSHNGAEGDEAGRRSPFGRDGGGTRQRAQGGGAASERSGCFGRPHRPRQARSGTKESAETLTLPGSDDDGGDARTWIHGRPARHLDWRR
jgi:hypothetical protein